MRYAREDCQTHANSHTFYLTYEGPLPARSAKEVKVDITIRERLVLPLVERAVVRGYEEYEDLPDDALVKVYPLDKIVVEKVVALGDRARNEPRDLYDVWYLTSEGHVDVGNLTAEVEAKLTGWEGIPDSSCIYYTLGSDPALWPAGERREGELIMHDKGYYHSLKETPS